MKPSIATILAALLLSARDTAGLCTFQPKTRELHPQMKDLENGAVLNVSIAAPAVNSTLPNAMDVNILGNTSVGKGEADVSYIYMMDMSESTTEEDGDCGTVLECVQAFFKALHYKATSDGSAELASVINFDDFATVSTSLQPPTSRDIKMGIEDGCSIGGANCVDALTAAAELVHDPSNTAGTTIAVFAGDGLCNEDEETIREAAKELGKTKATVHTVAIGDSVDCDMSHECGEPVPNNMIDILQNGGKCTSVPDPDALPDIIDDLIGTALKSLKLQVDGGAFNKIANANLTHDLPQEGAITVGFNVSLAGLAEGVHEVCVRSIGEDVLGGKEEIEDCHEFAVLPDPNDKVDGWKIFLLVAVCASFVLFFAFILRFACRAARVVGKETSAAAESVESAAPVHPGCPIV